MSKEILSTSEKQVAKDSEQGVDIPAQKRGLGDYDTFMEFLKKNMEEASPEKIEQTLVELERYSQTPERRIEVYTDPDLKTFCCATVPAERVTPEGEIVEDTSQQETYLIGVPFHFVVGDAPITFMRGEILHEQGHAKLTDFKRLKRFRTLANQEGYDPDELLGLDNCIEDPRMERLIGGPRHENQRALLFEKNRQMVIPNISTGIIKGNMTPTEQFKFILKLERLWAIHQADLGDTEKPWSITDLHPRVQEEYSRVESALSKITGDVSTPAMKVNAEVEKLIVEEFWPAHKRLIDEFPEDESGQADGDQGDQGGKEGKDKQGKPGKGKRGKKSGGEPVQEDPKNMDPSDPDSWPEEIRRVVDKFKQLHQKRLEKKAEQNKKDHDRRVEKKADIKNQEHNLQKSRDGFDDPEVRKQYNDIKAEIAPVIMRLKRTFQRFLPKVDEPQFEFGRKGIRFDARRYVSKIGSGHEQPLGRRRTPEKNGLVLQILIDVSGSMYDGRRIQNAVRGCIAVCEAAADHNIQIEILANDEGNVTDSAKYVIMPFGAKYSGRSKANIVGMLKSENYGGENKDANAIRAALPRLRKQAQAMRHQVDRLKTLTVYISDSTTQDVDTKKATDESRAFTAFEGTAITPEGDIPAKVKYHFGSDSIIPKSIDDFPDAVQQILLRHVSMLKPRE